MPTKMRARKLSLVVLQYRNDMGATMSSTTGASHSVFEDDLLARLAVLCKMCMLGIVSLGLSARK